MRRSDEDGTHREEFNLTYLRFALPSDGTSTVRWAPAPSG